LIEIPVGEPFCDGAACRGLF